MTMIETKIKELLEKNNMSRYKLQSYLGWNYKRINDYYFNRVKDFRREELEELCKLFKCGIDDLIVYKKDKK